MTATNSRDWSCLRIAFGGVGGCRPDEADRCDGTRPAGRHRPPPALEGPPTAAAAALRPLSNVGFRAGVAAAEAPAEGAAKGGLGGLLGRPGRRQHLRVGGAHYRASGHALRGRLLPCAPQLPEGLPPEPAQDEVRVGDLAPERLPGRRGLHQHSPPARGRSLRLRNGCRTLASDPHHLLHPPFRYLHALLPER